MFPLVSVVILNYNGGEVTIRCLDSVLKSSYPNFEVILIDNGSNEREVKRLKKLYGGKIKIFESTKNLGYSEGNNLGAEKAKGKYLIFLNNDTLVPLDWMNGPIQKLEEDAQIAFLQPKIKWLKQKNFFEYAGGAGGYLDLFGYPFVRGRIFGLIEEDIGQYDDEREVFWASGVALFTRKNIFMKLGLFDPFLFSHAEEEDICFRAHRFGYKVIFSPKSFVFHIGAYTDKRDMFKRTFYKHRNHLILLFKNLRYRDLVCILPFRFIKDCFASFYYLFWIGSPRQAWAVLYAYFLFAANFHKILKQRYGNKNRLKNFGFPKKQGLVYKGSIVWQYFILKKKRWLEVVEKKSCPSKLIKIF